MTIDGAQCRAARAMLGMTQLEVAKAAVVAHRTIVSLEQIPGHRQPMQKNLEAIRKVFEKEGIVFVDDGGVRRGVILGPRSGESQASDEVCDGDGSE